MAYRGGKATRYQRGWTHLGAGALGALERALRGQDPTIDPHRAAESLAKSREGTRLLVRMIESYAPAQLRAAAVYGFAWGHLRSPEICFLLRVLDNPTEHPAVRGQAAEALGPKLHEAGRGRPWHLRYLRARETFLRGLGDPAPEVRLWSIYALAHPENVWLVPRLETMTTDDAMVPGMWTVRQEALWAIHWITKHDIHPEPTDF